MTTNIPLCNPLSPSHGDDKAPVVIRVKWGNLYHNFWMKAPTPSFAPNPCQNFPTSSCRRCFQHFRWYRYPFPFLLRREISPTFPHPFIPKLTSPFVTVLWKALVAASKISPNFRLEIHINLAIIRHWSGPLATPGETRYRKSGGVEIIFTVYSLYTRAFPRGSKSRMTNFVTVVLLTRDGVARILHFSKAL